MSRRRSIDASVLVCFDGYYSTAISELSTICRKRKLGLGRLLGSSSLAILIGVIGNATAGTLPRASVKLRLAAIAFLERKSFIYSPFRTALARALTRQTSYPFYAFAI